MSERFLPGLHPVTRFGQGGFHFGGMSHQGSILALPSGMRALEARDIGGVTPALLAQLAAEKASIDFLLIGTGKAIQRAPAALAAWLTAEGINHDVMDTPAALRTYNVVLAEDRRVAAILIAVD